MRTEWPDWWSWELELVPHVYDRMADRSFTEVELRRMLKAAIGFSADVVPERYVISTRHGRRAWEVIVEPDAEARLLVVVTAYPVK